MCCDIGIRRGDGRDEGVVVLGSEEVTGQIKGVVVLGSEEVTGQMKGLSYWDQKR